MTVVSVVALVVALLALGLALLAYGKAVAMQSAISFDLSELKAKPAEQVDPHRTF